MRGLAHIGVLQAFEENGIPIAGIVGTSMGAIIGGLAASGYSSSELREVVTNLDLTNLLMEKTNPLFVPSGLDSVTPANKFQWVAMNKGGEVVGPLGGISGIKLLERFAQLASRSRTVRFDDLEIPFAAVATDLETGRKVVLRTGSLASAMRASMAIPAVFDPWPMGDKLLVDGGLVSNLPVETARDVFPGYPVVAVDVSGTLKSRKEIRSLLDVIDQSLTIFTRRNVENEIVKADLAILPPVEGVTIFDMAAADGIIAGGRASALQKMSAIKKLSDSAPAPPQKELMDYSPLVKGIRVEGATSALSGKIRGKYGTWTGKPLSNLNVIKASSEIAEEDDVLSVDYRLEESGENVDVVFMIQRKPSLEINFGGYSTNLHSQRWLYFNGVRRDLLREGDSLKWNIKVGEQWGLDASYFTSPDRDNAWEFLFSAQKWEVKPENAGDRSWNRYAVGVTRHMRFGSFLGGPGFAFERIDGGGRDYEAFGPTFYLSSNTLNDPSDPADGALFLFRSWWPDGEELLFRLMYFQAARLSDSWRLFFRAGFAEGDEAREGRAVYLGAMEELYSYSGHPVRGERMAWFNIALRRVLMKSWWGSLNTELFGGMGFVYDDSGDRYRNLWETGISFSVPGLLLDGKLMFLYNDEEDFKVGFFIGSPLWGHYPLP